MNELEEKRKKLRNWLLNSGMTREALAKELNVSVASVNNWLSCTNIPAKRWENIKDLFEQPEDKQEQRDRIVGAAFTCAELEQLKKIAGDSSLEEFARKTLLAEIDRILAK